MVFQRLSFLVVIAILSTCTAGKEISIHDPTVMVGRVVGVSDGDTITVLNAGVGQKIRLYGIDCPEKGQPFSSRAKQMTSDLAFGKEVTVHVKDVDRYQRTIGEVFLPNGANLNRELVSHGLARWYQKYAPHDTTIARLEQSARENKRGIWSVADSMAPWDWRRLKRSGGGKEKEVQKNALLFLPSFRALT